MEESLRVLAPTQKKLTSIESQRIMCVAIETSKRLKRALSLPHLIDDLDRFSVSLGEELVELLEEYKHMSMRYTSLHQSLEVEGINPVHLLSRTSTPEPSRTMLEPINATYEETFVKTHLQLKNITKNILRLLNRGSPITDDSDTLSAISNTAVHTLETALTQFMDIVQEKLLTTSIDEKRKTDHIKATRQREVETDTIIQQLEQELAEAQAKRDKEVCSVVHFVCVCGANSLGRYWYIHCYRDVDKVKQNTLGSLLEYTRLDQQYMYMYMYCVSFITRMYFVIDCTKRNTEETNYK